MVRSGSTWSYNVALKLLKSCYPDRKTFGFFSEDPAVLAAAVRPRFSNLVIKSHRLDRTANEICRRGALKTIYTWRHPYDAVASSVQMFGQPVEDAIDAVRNALRVWSFHRATNSACIVSYEAIMTEPSAAITRISRYLQLTLEPEALTRIADEVSFARMNRLSQHVSELSPVRLVEQNGLMFDRETLLHNRHIRSGSIGYGASLLDSQNLRTIDAMLREEDFSFLCEPDSGCRNY